VYDEQAAQRGEDVERGLRAGNLRLDTDIRDVVEPSTPMKLWVSSTHTSEVARDIAVVHVHRHGAELEGGEHPLEVLGAGHEQEPHVIARPDTSSGEIMREAVRALVELGLGELAPRPDDHRCALADRVHDLFEQHREVV
jgi:hypothetical protein